MNKKILLSSLFLISYNIIPLSARLITCFTGIESRNYENFPQILNQTIADSLSISSRLDPVPQDSVSSFLLKNNIQQPYLTVIQIEEVGFHFESIILITGKINLFDIKTYKEHWYTPSYRQAEAEIIIHIYDLFQQTYRYIGKFMASEKLADLLPASGIDRQHHYQTLAAQLTHQLLEQLERITAGMDENLTLAQSKRQKPLHATLQSREKLESEPFFNISLDSLSLSPKEEMLLNNP